MIYRLYNRDDPLPDLTIYRLGFSGHRFLRGREQARCADTLLGVLAKRYPGAVWVHGGAADGFDNQVWSYAWGNLIGQEPHRPDYDRYRDRPKYAPIARNYQIVDSVQMMVFLWDGRTTGGTWRTYEYARHLGEQFPIVLMRPL